MRKILSIVILSLMVLVLVFPAPVSADLVTCGGPTEPPCTLCNFFELIHSIFSFVFDQVVPVVATLMVVIGGAIYMTSIGRPEKIQDAKKLFTALFIGLIITYGSWLLINLFLTTLKVTIFTGGSWSIISCN